MILRYESLNRFFRFALQAIDGAGFMLSEAVWGMIVSIEDLVAEVMRRDARPMALSALVEALQGSAPDKDSTDVKFAVLSLVRQGKANFDPYWKVRSVAS